MKIIKNFTAGNKGEKVRSDCFISLQLRESGGIEINLSSKVNSIYGNHIKLFCNEIFDYFDIDHAFLNIEEKDSFHSSSELYV